MSERVHYRSTDGYIEDREVIHLVVDHIIWHVAINEFGTECYCIESRDKIRGNDRMETIRNIIELLEKKSKEHKL